MTGLYTTHNTLCMYVSNPCATYILSILYKEVAQQVEQVVNKHTKQYEVTAKQVAHCQYTRNSCINSLADSGYFSTFTSQLFLIRV